MRYIRKMCILRQIRQGFSGDGKTLSGLIKLEQYGKNLAVEVSIINFAPLSVGEYYCLLSDGKGKTEMLSLRGKSIFNILSDLDISAGFCGIICYAHTEVVPVAYGINGNGSYDWRTILNKALPPVFPTPSPSGEIAGTTPAYIPYDEENEPTMYEMNANIPVAEEIPVVEVLEEVRPAASYDDERVSEHNYYEVNDERKQPAKISEDANHQSAAQGETAQTGTDATANDHAQNLLDETDGEEYYRSVQRELDGLFSRYPHDASLKSAFSYSEWARIKGSAKEPEYLVGAVYEEGRVKYICYALKAEHKEAPPEEIKGVCSFVPRSPAQGSDGFFVIFQSAATGECIKPLIR